MEQLVIIDEFSTDPGVSFFPLNEIDDIVVTEKEIEICHRGEGTTKFTHNTTRDEAWRRVKEATETLVKVIYIK